MEDREHRAQSTGQRMACIIRSPSSILGSLTLIALVLAAGGCNSSPFQSSPWPSLDRMDSLGGYQVVPRSGGQPADLAAPDIVQVMRYIGFGDEQIVTLGPRLRDSLRTAGAAIFARGNRPEVLLAVNDGFLFVQSADRGSFIYDIEDKLFAAVPPMPAR